MSFPSFREFYANVYGQEPFPWQARLAEEVLEDGWSGRVLDLPTGVGKTSALDVALYALARAPERMPRRTLLVVDRRIVVDQGAAHAFALRLRLDAAKSGPARVVADALRATWNAAVGEPCFAVAVMRGGMPRDNDWARRPDQPVLGVSTVDQVGSRLLFRGYGIMPASAPIHAGLLGEDTLILLDEVHLSQPFSETLTAIATRYRHRERGLPDRFAVIAMSATVGQAPERARTFGLTAADRAHPVLRSRLEAHKRARLKVVKVKGDDEETKRIALAQQAVDEARQLQTAGARVVGLVFNRVDTARVAARLATADAALEDDGSVVLVTGRMRPLDRDRVVRDMLLPAAAAGRDREASQDPRLIIATQCIEAGADLDFDALVTEVASLDALRQRFGRVDRRGALGDSESVILGRSDQVNDSSSDAVYGAALAATWGWLESIATKDGEVDFGVAHLPEAVDGDGRALSGLLASRAHAPVLMPAHLDTWAHTSVTPTPDPDVALWLHGPEQGAADVQVVWRDLGGALGGEAGDTADPSWLVALSAIRPSSLEAISLPIAVARRWLAKAQTPAIADVEASAEDDEPIDGRNAPPIIRWAGDASRLINHDEVSPGDVLVLPISRGGLEAASFSPSAEVAVSDLAELAELRGRGRCTLRLQPSILRSWGLDPSLIDAMPQLEDGESLRAFAERAREWLATWPERKPEQFAGTTDEWRAWLDGMRLRPRVLAPMAKQNDDLLLILQGQGRPTRVTNDATLGEISELITEDDDSSFRRGTVTLLVHSADVKDRATAFARSLGLPDDLIEDLALAGWLHDAGKADPRFQRWLVGGDEIALGWHPEPLAKSPFGANQPRERRLARERAGYPSGYRHELLSLAMVAKSPDVLVRAHDPDLVLHLVASHHGWCRPFAPPVDDEHDEEVTVQLGTDRLSAMTRHRAASLDSGVSDRFWRLTERYGWWGLAWLEAILRLADHRASEARENLEVRS